MISTKPRPLRGVFIKPRPLGVVDDFVPMKLESNLPVKIEADGNLILQARPGEWTIEITSRHKGPVDELTFDPSGMVGGVDQEIWVFEAKNHLRIVSINGAVQIRADALKHIGFSMR